VTAPVQRNSDRSTDTPGPVTLQLRRVLLAAAMIRLSSMVLLQKIAMLKTVSFCEALPDLKMLLGKTNQRPITSRDPKRITSVLARMRDGVFGNRLKGTSREKASDILYAGDLRNRKTSDHWNQYVVVLECCGPQCLPAGLSVPFQVPVRIH
jgi:hypothetical protein